MKRSPELFFVFALLLLGCPAPPPVETPDMCSGAACDPFGCNNDNDCARYPDRKLCVSNLCVQCTDTAKDCPMGFVCVTSTHTCAPGCTGGRNCPADGGVCEQNSGACVECLGDNDCLDPAAKSCDLTTHRCFACVAGVSDNCPAGAYCGTDQNGKSRCLAGCKADKDCPLSVGDGGAGDPALKTCDPKKHVCIECAADADCPLGRVCKGDRCAEGCTDTHGCANNLGCCNGYCADVTFDSNNCGSCGRICPNGNNCCAATCSDPIADVKNCGGCGVACIVANGTPKCAASTCQVAFCKTGFADCNGLYNDGCETDLTTNVYNCGACNQVCSIRNAQPQCASSQCAIDVCIAPWADCDGDVKNGCEIAVDTDALHCGACPNACSKNHIAQPACRTALCVGACDAGYADCNGDKLKDGCETNTGGDINNCGACGVRCAGVNGNPSCDPMLGCRITCAQLYADCDGDVKTGCETNLRTLTDCGACRTPCMLPNATTTCASGKCEIDTCGAGFADCDKMVVGCETRISTDAMNCGSCGTVCSSNHGTPACAAGQCRITCDANFADCNVNPGDGCEISLATDVANCGACGRACNLAHAASQACMGGACGITEWMGNPLPFELDHIDGNRSNNCLDNLRMLCPNCHAQTETWCRRRSRLRKRASGRARKTRR